MKFSDKLAKMRKANNLSQEQLADELGVTRQSVSKWESGDSYPDMAKIVQICKKLNCTINDILDDEVVSAQTPEKTIETKDLNKTNIIKKYFDELLEFVKKTVNMISHMKFSQILKMVIELTITATIMYLICSLVLYGIDEFLWNLLGDYTKAYQFFRSVFTSIGIIGGTILSALIVIYVYKIRYLDYYVTLTDNNVSEQSVEEPIKENQSADFTDNKKEKVVIIRDPKHSSSKVIDGLVSVIVFLCKAFILLCAIPVILAILASVAGLVICIIRKGYIFKSSILICLGALIFSVVVLVFFYNVIFNRKQLHKLNIILVIVSLLLGGAGCGLLANNITNLKIKEDNTPVSMIKKQIILSDLKDEDTIYIEANNIDYVIDENSNDITLDFEYPISLSINQDDYQTEHGHEYYYVLFTNDLFEFKEFLNDLADNTISDSYDISNYLKVKVTCNSANKAKLALMGY